MTTYQQLPDAQKKELKKFPAYISLLAATYHNHGMDKLEKQTAIEFTHVKTFQSKQMLRDFYSDVEKDFEQTLTLLNEQLPKQKKAREDAINRELTKLKRF